jgi:type II secretory pathway pseudopilin PulG
MKDLFELLTERERRIAAIVGAVLGIAACVLIYAAAASRGAATRAAAEFRAADDATLALERDRSSVRKEWQAWKDAQKDLASLKETGFYDGSKGLQDMRMDLQRIFDTSGIAASDITYGYTDIVKGALQKVNADFRFTVSYAVLKGLLDTVERSARFLHIERVDILSMTKQPGIMDLRVTFAGYYAY